MGHPPRKWVVAVQGGLAIRAGYHKPPYAICEAPDHFTADMGPYIEIVHGISNDGVTRTTTVVLKPEYATRNEAGHGKDLDLRKKSEKISKAVLKAQSNEKFNQMNPIHRAASNILGKNFDSPRGPLMKMVCKMLMKKSMVFLLFLIPVMGFAQETPQEHIDINATIQSIFDYIQHGKPVMAASAGILILVYLFRRYALPKLQLGNGVLPILSVVLGAIIGVLSQVIVGISPAEAAKIVLISGPGASMFWATVIKLFMKKD